MPSVLRLCRLRFRQRVLWPLRRPLVRLLRWGMVECLCLFLRLLLGLLWLGARASSKSPRAS